MANFFFPEFQFPNQRSSGDGPYIITPLPVTVPAGQMITPHIHPNTDEILRVISGTGIANLLIDDPTPDVAGQIDNVATVLLQARVKAGDVIFFPRGNPHWILNPLKRGDATNPSTQPNPEPSGDLVIETSFENAGFDTLFVQSISNGIPANVLAGALNGAPGDLTVPF
jgi:mannose-6-phosphate isomerase-like protein (cupin superfamily)